MKKEKREIKKRRTTIKFIKKYILKAVLLVTLATALSLSDTKRSEAFFGMDSAAMIPFLSKILHQAINQYNQLKTIYSNAKRHKEMIESINQGLHEAIGLLEGFSLEDADILKELKSFKSALNHIEKVYGEVPKGQEEELLKLHDETVAESIKISNALKKYAKIQEDNSMRLSQTANSTSPKGAARANVKTNAAILHTLNQLLKVNGQMLKLQSEQLALNTKFSKESNLHFEKVNEDLSQSLKAFSGTLNTPRF